MTLVPVAERQHRRPTIGVELLVGDLGPRTLVDAETNLEKTIFWMVLDADGRGTVGSSDGTP